MTAADHKPLIVESKAAAGTQCAPLRLQWRSEQDTEDFARRLAALPQLADAFVTLHGDRGAGKTTLVRHLLRGLGVTGRIKSPTYAVVEPYVTPCVQVWHFDFYRFADPQEWEDAGLRDIFATPGLKLVEWPDKAGDLLPQPDWIIRLSSDVDEVRHITLEALTPRGVTLMQEAT